MDMERPDPILSPREHQLLRLAAAGFTDMAIAEQLGISEATVGTYWGRVRIKFGPYSRTELVAIMLRAESEATVESLRIENAQLVEEMKLQLTSGSSLSARELLEKAPDAILLVSEVGIIEYANGAAFELFGYDRGELEGKDLSLLIPPAFRKQHAELAQAYISDPDRRRMGAHSETPAAKKGGAVFPINAALSAIDSPNGTVVMCAVRGD